jgi:RHS repeat-associated protein
MKKIVSILVLFSSVVFSQSTDQNYVKSTTYKQPVTAAISAPDINVANVQINYFDGLGRPIQQVAHKQSNTGKDIVTHIEYDAFGRQTKEFLPFANASASLNYMTSASTDLATFYSSYNGGTTNPFSEKQLESSPLNRVFKQAAPGDAWALGEGKEIKFDYQTNTETEVKLFKATATWNASFGIYDISITHNGNYQANQLYKTITKDENWTSGNNNTTEEFKDKEGKVVLKRTYNNNEAHDTYYVYDPYGNLTYVIPPLAEGLASEDNLNYLGYQYKYDARNRLVEKKLPGKQWEFIVYDKLDRPVATGPAFSPYGDQSIGWLITQYDVFNRVVQTGWRAMPVTAATRYEHQKNINGGGNPFVLSVNDVLTKNYYDNYTFTGAPNPLPALIENQEMATNVKGLQTGSWVKVLDNASSTLAETSYTLYDYKYRPVHTKTTNHLGGYTQVDTHLDWAGKTLYTQTKHKRTNNDTELVVKDKFEYTPQDRLAVHKQQINNLPEELITKNSYDELGQLTSKNVGGAYSASASGLQTVDYSYNIRGWLKSINNIDRISNDLFAFKINYNDAETATPLYNGNIAETFWKTSSDNIKRKYNYSYDNLNRLLQADYSKQGSTEFNSYLEHLTYDKNGNIQTLLRNGDMDTDGMQFVNPIDNLTYLYDENNKNQLLRVFDATANPIGFKDDTDGVDINQDIEQSPDYTYDANGNMIKDTNKGIANITYNHLNLPTTILFVNNNSIFYLYNALGQKVQKSVDEIVNNQAIYNQTDYLAGFQYHNTVLKHFPHAEGYVNATQNGTSYTFNYVYNYTDHLGNIRLSYSLDPSTNVLKIIEENHYYPFGLKHTGYNSDQMMYVKEASVLKIKPKPPLFKTVYDKKFNGKSWETDLSLNIYDFHARGYMPDIVRTFQQDPLAEKFSNMSPYSFLNNNPLRFTDPTGMASDDIIIIGSKNNQLKYENGNLYNLDGTSYTGKIDKFTQKTVDALGEISKSTEGASMIKELQSSSNTFTIENGKYNNFTPSKSTSAMSNIPELQAAEPSLKPSNGSGGRIVFNPNSNSSGLNTSGNTNRPEYIGLAHEMFHGRDANNGVMYPSSDWKSFKAEHNGLYKSEWRAVFYENTVRSQLKIPLRTHYGLSIDSQGNQSGMGPRLLDSNNNPINYTIK